MARCENCYNVVEGEFEVLCNACIAEYDPDVAAAEQDAELEALEDYYGPEDNLTDAEADADTLASAGYGTDEDYGCYGSDNGDWD
jgi:hypothetical protein